MIKLFALMQFRVDSLAAILKGCPKIRTAVKAIIADLIFP